ncbi:hypothetical protein HispidOSU_020201 [Sigmodon hispidus]
MADCESSHPHPSVLAAAHQVWNPPPQHLMPSICRTMLRNVSLHLWASYQNMWKLVYDLLPRGVSSLLNLAAIYSNNEISLSDTEAYGFVYNYTLAQQENVLHHEIFNAVQRHPDRAFHISQLCHLWPPLRHSEKPSGEN